MKNKRHNPFKMTYRYFALLLAFMAQQIMAAVNVTISDGMDNETAKAKMERTMSALLTEANAAQSEHRALKFSGLGIDQRVQESVSMLWENSPFECTDEEIVETAVQTGTGYQVRNIPLLMRPTDANFNEDEYQEAVFTFDKGGNLQSFYLTISANLYMSVIRGNKEITDLRRREQILDYVEHFRTAYNQKDIGFLDAVFSDDALIITGRVIERKPVDGVKMPDKVVYTKQSKKQYLTNLRRVFAANKHIKVTFDEIAVMRHPANKDFYGVTLHQGYTSDRYHDDGYVFLLWNFKDEAHPQITVRTWQPDAYDTDGSGTKKRIDKDDVFSLSDFDI